VAIVYRYYRNQYAPALMNLWNLALQTRGCCIVPKPSVFEAHIFSKPWFDPKSLLLAFDADQIAPPLVGAALAGFGPDEKAREVDTKLGIVSLIMVHPQYRRQRIATALLKYVEGYFAERGATEIQAGSSLDRSPYLWGMLGSSSPTGVLRSDYGAPSFLYERGYRPRQRSFVLTRPLDKAVPMGDSRFPGLRRRFSLKYHPRQISCCREEAVEGSLEPVFFDLMETAVDRQVAQIRGWDMSLFSLRSKIAQAGLYALHVKSDWRGMGLGKYLFCLVLQHLQEQLYGLVELVVPDENQKVRKLFEGLGFGQVDEGWAYTKTL
jgi:ribosomal protein S18 acetylase RimI-like enzyme